jgi:hypothetical protein
MQSTEYRHILVRFGDRTFTSVCSIFSMMNILMFSERKCQNSKFMANNLSNYLCRDSNISYSRFKTERRLIVANHRNFINATVYIHH